MTSLLSINIPLLAYRYLNEYGPNDEPVGSVTIAVYETSLQSPAVNTGWCCCKRDYDKHYKNAHNCCDGTCDKLPTNNELFPDVGFTFDGNTLILLFDELIGKQWRHKTLAPENVHIESAPFPIVFLPFSPSIENLAYVIYKIMKKEVAKRYKHEVAYVDVLHPSGDYARYDGNNFKINHK